MKTTMHNCIWWSFISALAIMAAAAVFSPSSAFAQQYTQYYYPYGYPYGGYYQQQYQYYPYYYYHYYQYPYYHYYYNYNYNYNPLNVSCYPNAYYSYVGNYVTWTAYVSGGSGSYSYSWTGSDAVTNSNTNSISVLYSTPGTKYVYLTVSSGGQSTSRYCGSVQVFNYYYYPYPRPW